MKKVTLLLLSAFIVFVIYGCGGGGSMGLTGGSWDSGDVNNPSVNTSSKIIEINGTFSAPAAPSAGAPFNRAIDVSGGRYTLSVIDKDNPSFEAGSIGVGANSFKAVIQTTAVNRHAMIVLTDKQSKKVIYRNLLGKILKIGELPASVSKVVINGILINETTTARALFAMEKGVSDIAVTSVATNEIQTGGIVTKDYTGIKTEFDTAAENSAGGAANISQMANAVQAVAAVLASTQINESTKNTIAADQIISATSLLTSYLNSLKNPSASQLITNNGFAVSVKIGDTTINSTSDSTIVTNAVKNITPIAPVSTPVFQPAGGNYSQDVNVVITTATPGATIRYTIDGSVPSALSGNIYGGPIVISNTTTIKAVAVKSGYADSQVVSALYTLPLKAAAPVITPAAGTYTSAQTITIVSATTGAVIKYTTDGTNPSETNGQTYSVPFTLGASAAVRAVAIKSGMNNSNITTVSYVINTEKASAPIFTPTGGTFSTAQSVTIATTTVGAVIKYTTDGSAPSSSNGLVYSSAITVAASSTIKAIAIKTGMADSDISSVDFTIQDTVSAPVFNPPAGSYAAAQSVSIISATSGASIFYTTNGSTPTILSSQYTSAVSIVSTATIKAIAVKTGMAASTVSSADYTIMQKVSAPVFDPAAGSHEGTQSVTITSATSGSAIYYTLDGSTPSVLSTLYSGAVSIASNLTIRAIALKSGMSDSDISTASYTINFPPVSDPVFSVTSGTYNDTKSVTITSATSGASIYYTLDNTNPSSSSYLYTSAIEIGNTAVIKAIAVKTGMANSNISVASYVIDKLAPSFNIQYYSDAALSLSLGNNPRLSAGTYYLKITSNKELQSAPTVTIGAEGSANDVTNGASTLFSGYSYKYNRVIASDNAAIGSVVETLALAATDKAGNAASNIRPVNESSAAAYTDTVAPTAAITYSPVSASVKQGAVLAISAVISENLAGAYPLKIAIAGANTLDVINMTTVDATHYNYSHTVGAGNGSATITLSNAKDLAGNPITAAPSSGGSFSVDNTAPAAPTSVTITPVGGNIKANTLNLTNTNMTAAATITAGQATGGSAQLLIDGIIKAHDTSIAAGDTGVTFDLGKASPAELQATVPVSLNAKTVTVKLFDAAGNDAVSSVNNPVITVDYTAPTAPAGIVLTPAGGTVVANTLNSTNTNMTATATITAGQATDGLAVLLINDEIKAQDITISAADTALAFDLGKTTVGGLQATVPVGLNAKAVKVKLIDAAGNETTSSVSVNIAVDYTRPTGSISYLPSATAIPGSSLTVLATFSEAIADAPVMQVAISGSNTLSAVDMSKTSSTQYGYIHTVGNGTGAANVTFATGTDVAGNPVTEVPTVGESFTVNNAVLPAGVYKKVAVLDAINDATLAVNTLTVKTAGTNTEYDVSSNNTIKSIMGGENNIKFTIDANGKVSVIDDSLAAASSTIALVAADCASALTLKGSANGATTLTAAAAFANNITVTSGIVNIGNANLDGTLTVSAAATITAGDNALTVSNTAGTVTLTGAGAITKTGAGTLALNLSTGNAGAISVSDSPSITITNTTAGSATARTVGDVTLGTGALSITGGAGTNHITVGQTLGATAGTVSITGGAANVAIGNLATTGALSITAGAGTITAGTYTGNPSITGGGTGVITLGAITGNVSVTGHAASALNLGAVTATAVNVATGAAAVTIGAVTGNVTVVDAAGGNAAVNLGAVSGTLGITSGSNAPITVALGANNITGVTTITGGTTAGNKVTLTGSGTGTTNIAGGHVDVSGRSNATLNITAASTVTAGANPVSTADTAFTASITGTGLVTIGNASTVVISGVTVPGSNVATVQQAGTALTINGVAAGAVSVASDSSITAITINADTVTSLTNNKALLASLTVNAGKTLTTLTMGGTTITTLTNNGTIGTIAAGSAATIGTLITGTAGVITNALATGANLTITNIDQTGITADRTINLGNYANSINVTGPAAPGANKVIIISDAGIAAITVKAGVVDLSGVLTDDTLNISTTAAASVDAGAKAVTVAALSHDSTITTTGAITVGADLTGALKLGAAPSSLTANGSLTLDIDNKNVTIADIAASEIVTLTNAGDGSAGAISVTKAGSIAGTLVTTAAKTFNNITISSGTTLAALTNAGTVTTLANSATITTLTNNGTLGTLSAPAAAIITTLTLGASGAITNALTTAGNLTITNIDQSAVASVKTLNLGNLSTAITTVKGHSASKLTLVGTGNLTANIADGHVDVEGLAAGAIINVVGTAGTTDTINIYASGKSVILSGANLNGASDSVTIDRTLVVLAVSAVTVSGAVTTLTVSAPVETITVGGTVTTLNANDNVTTKLDINSGGVATVNVADGKTITLMEVGAPASGAMIVAVAGTGAITTATYDANLITHTLTVNDTVAGSAAIGILNVPAQTTSFTTAGSGTITTVSTTGIVPTLTVGSTIGTLNVGGDVTTKLDVTVDLATLNNNATIADLSIANTKTVAALNNGATATGVVTKVTSGGTGTITTLNMITNFANTLGVPADVTTKLVIGTLNVYGNAGSIVTLGATTGTTATKLEIGNMTIGDATGGQLLGSSGKSSAFTLKGSVTLGVVGQLGNSNAADLAATVDRAAERTITKTADATSIATLTLTGILGDDTGNQADGFSVTAATPGVLTTEGAKTTASKLTVPTVGNAVVSLP